MRYSEFEREIKGIDFRLDIKEIAGELLILLRSEEIAWVSTISEYKFCVKIDTFQHITEEMKWLITQACVNLSKTSVEKRKEDTKYIVRHKYLNMGEDNYLNVNKENGALRLGKKEETENIQSEFTEDELKNKLVNNYWENSFWKVERVR